MKFRFRLIESEDNRNIFMFPQTPQMDSALSSLNRDGYNLEIVCLAKIIKDNDLLAIDMGYHNWEKDISKYKFDASQIPKWLYSDIISGVENADGKILLDNGRHRCIALFNDGYTHIQMPIKKYS